MGRRSTQDRMIRTRRCALEMSLLPCEVAETVRYHTDVCDAHANTVPHRNSHPPRYIHSFHRSGQPGTGVGGRNQRHHCDKPQESSEAVKPSASATASTTHCKYHTHPPPFLHQFTRIRASLRRCRNTLPTNTRAQCVGTPRLSCGPSQGSPACSGRAGSRRWPTRSTLQSQAAHNIQTR